MFRLGSALFIPAYLTVTLYRPLASENDDGSVFLMGGECVALRWVPCELTVFSSALALST